jgi:predicted transcriptional regulator
MSQHLLDSIGAWWSRDDTEFQINLAACRAALSESEFTKAQEQGRAMTMEQATAYALEDSKN